MKLKNWPLCERPQEKLLKFGAEHLSDAELLAIFLRTGIKDKPVVTLARELISKFGSLKNLLNAPFKKMSQHKGLGVAKYSQIKAILEINRRYLFEEIQEKTILNHSEKVKQFLVAKMGHLQNESFACIFLNSIHRIISFKTLFTGTIDKTQIHPREIIKIAISENAKAIILVHNHPSGNTTPSNADITLTQQLKSALKLIDINLLDHIIIGQTKAISIAEQGLITAE